MANRILDAQRAAGGNAILDVQVPAPVVSLVGATTTQSAISGTGAVTVTPPALGIVNLAGSSTTQSATSSTGAITVTPFVPGIINLAGSNATQGATCSTGAVTAGAASRQYPLAGRRQTYPLEGRA